MKFSICIPNYNYGRYLRETIQSVLDQCYDDLEIIVSDNASTDDSLAVVRDVHDSRVSLYVNRCNVGFAGNLDRAASRATGDRIILLSSDDLMRDNALATYNQVITWLPTNSSASIITSTVDIIDASGNLVGATGPDREMWLEEDRCFELEDKLHSRVYAVPCDVLLRRCLTTMKNPFNFAATCYSRAAYEAVEGYGGGRLINPDKWFHWKLISRLETAYWVDKPLFAYRWHSTNQTAQQSTLAALKYPVDEYISTLEVTDEMLQRGNTTRSELIEAFIERDIARHGLATLARGDRIRAKRLLSFGRSCYPEYASKNRRTRLLSFLISLGALGKLLANRAYKKYRPQTSGTHLIALDV